MTEGGASASVNASDCVLCGERGPLVRDEADGDVTDEERE